MEKNIYNYLNLIFDIKLCIMINFNFFYVKKNRDTDITIHVNIEF